jgi:hypothetical protein
LLSDVHLFGTDYLPNKPCRPITYPEGKRTGREGREISYTPDSLDKVFKFYTERLKATEVVPEASDGTWWLERRSQQLVFACMAVDINLLTTETGCVYLSEESSKTKIEIQFLRSEGANWYCQ